MIARLKLVDTVAVAAAALLSLKALGLAAGASSAGGHDGTPEPQGFARALSHARTNYVPPDVARTGSTAAGTLEVPLASPAAPEPADPAPASPAERAILERLGERREEWQQRGRDLELRERLLEQAERKLEVRIGELRALEERTDAGAKRGEAPGAPLKSLVTMYETMKPKEAARVFDRLPHEVLVPVVLQMNPRKMAEVLAVMAPEAAERLTVALAKRGEGGSEPAARAAGALPANELPAIDAPVR